MKKLFFNFNRLLLLSLAVMTVGNVFGATTVTFTNKDWAPWTNITSGSSFESASPARGVANNGVNGSCESPASFSGVTKIEVVASSNTTGGKVAIYIGSNKIGEESIAKSNNATYTYTPSSAMSGIIKIQVTKPSSKTVYVKSITITAASGYTVTCEATPSGYGSVDPTSVSNVASGTSISKNGATLTIGTNTVTATAATQTAEWTYSFSDWSWSPSGSTVTAATTATATFTRAKRTYDVSKTLNNCYVKSGSTIPATVEYGGSINATITANSGYQLPADITVTGGTKSWNQSTGALSITNITGAVSITITATVACSSSITITKGSPSYGTFDLSPTGSVCIDGGNATATISNISPATHYHFKTITTSASGSVDNDQKKVTNISASTTINVTFEEDTKYTVTFTDAMHGTDCSAHTMSNQYAGVQIVFPSLTDKDKHTPSGDCLADHYHFVGWVESGVTPTQSPSNVIVAGTTSINVSKTVTYKAVWAKEDTSK